MIKTEIILGQVYRFSHSPSAQPSLQLPWAYKHRPLNWWYFLWCPSIFLFQYTDLSVIERQWLVYSTYHIVWALFVTYGVWTKTSCAKESHRLPCIHQSCVHPKQHNTANQGFHIGRQFCVRPEIWTWGFCLCSSSTIHSDHVGLKSFQASGMGCR
jgi:hypothetical protein